VLEHGRLLPKAFLARYAAIDLRRLGREELRLPLFAQILGFQIADTGFHRQWHNRDEDRFFNAGGSDRAGRDQRGVGEAEWATRVPSGP
jgi:hypothetical protein